MSQFFTLSFELEGSEGKTSNIVRTVQRYLADQGAKDVLFTHSGDPDSEEDEAETTKSRRR
jgi:hypothetical protein